MANRVRSQILLKKFYIENGMAKKLAASTAATVESGIFKTCNENEYIETIYEILAGKSIVSETTNLWELECFKTQRENQRKLEEMLTGNVEVVEGVLTCPRCHNKKVMSYEVQIRSADEPMTTFATCAIKGCGHKWQE